MEYFYSGHVTHLIFTAQCYAITVCSMMLLWCVCLVLYQNGLGSHKEHHMIARRF